jgi:hypothetical protein
MYPIGKYLTIIASALAIFAYVLFWLTQHRFLEQPHHYLTALVIAGWLAVLPFVAVYHYERSKHHGLLGRASRSAGRH